MSIGNKQIMADNIKRLLKQKGLNPHQMALELNLKYTTVNDWVNAKSYPRIDKIELMANFFGVSKSNLVESSSSFSNQLKEVEIALSEGLEQSKEISKLASSAYDSFLENALEVLQILKETENAHLLDSETLLDSINLLENLIKDMDNAVKKMLKMNIKHMELNLLKKKLDKAKTISED